MFVPCKTRWPPGVTLHVSYADKMAADVAQGFLALALGFPCFRCCAQQIHICLSIAGDDGAP